MKKVIEANEQSFDQEVLKSNVPVLVDFYATWCGPCRRLAPELDKLAGELDGQAKVVKVNVDDAGALAMRYSITAVPTLMVFAAGKVTQTALGYVAPRELKAMLEEAGAKVA